MTTSDWFSTKPTLDDRGTAFVSALAAAAEQWAFADLSAADTSADLDHENGRLLVEVRIPGLTSERRTLRISYRSDVAGLPVLESAWSHPSHSFDDYDGPWAPDEEIELWVSGVDATPEQCGVWAAGWLKRQLDRRIVRREWDRPTSGLGALIPADDTGPVAVEWLIDSPDRHFDSRGGFTWWWLMRRPPSREVVERPGPQPPSTGPQD